MKLRLFLLAGVLLMAASVIAQNAQDFSKVEIKTTKLTDKFYTLEGQGGTIGALVGPDGVFLVDTQFAPLTEKIVAAVKKISSSPIKFVVNTHVHGDHTGGNENFGKMGAVIFSRDQLRARLARPTGNAQPAPAAALPVVTYDGPVTIHMNGEDVQLIPIRSAHTDGDTLVRFPGLDVLMTGDYYRSVGYPNIDRANGGTLNGMLEGLGRTIGLAGPNTKIIPGHGPTVDRAAVTAHRDMILGVRDRVAGMVKQGKTAQEIIAAKPTADYDSKIEQAAMTSERFINQLYAELGGK
ncbi:MAG: MBL fold metallo-hydrolase [Acidobacteria bacterium]|nr:MAG: MBL fold metallo-hydrolase [Acidobacteriota bacterium]